MQIDCDLLIAWGGVSRKYGKDEIIFHEDAFPTFYYQIIEGQVKLMNLSSEGKEFIQGIFYTGDSFGEPPLFINQPYPCTSVVQKDSIIMRLSRESFLKMLADSPSLQSKFLQTLSARIYHKSVSSREIINNPSPELRILGFLKSEKKRLASDKNVLITHTRQEIANLTGLRVETVIRTLRTMSEQKKVSIIEHKLYY